MTDAELLRPFTAILIAAIPTLLALAVVVGLVLL